MPWSFALVSLIVVAQATPDYRSTEGAFTVAFPEKPQIVRTTTPYEEATLATVQALCRQERRSYLVMSAHWPKTHTVGSSLSSLSGLVEGFAAKSRLIEPPSDVTAGGVKGKQYFMEKLELPEGSQSFIKFRVFVTGDRSYNIAFAAYTEQEARTGGDAFLDSFSPIKPKPLAPGAFKLPTDWKTTSPPGLGATVRMPGEVEEKSKDTETPYGTLKTRRFVTTKRGVGIFSVAAIELNTKAVLAGPSEVLDAFARLQLEPTGTVIRDRKGGVNDIRFIVDVPNLEAGQPGVAYLRYRFEGHTVYEVAAYCRRGFELEPPAQAYLDSLTVP
jgi:hypothetical protein